MQRATSAPAASTASAARSTSVSGLNATPTPRPRSRACRATPFCVVDHLHVERHAVAAGLPDALEVPLWLGDHEVALEHSPSLVHEPRNQRSTIGPTVISAMKWPSPTSKWKTRGCCCFEQASELFTKTGEVRSVDRRLDGARTCPLSPSHRLTVPRGPRRRKAPRGRGCGRARRGRDGGRPRHGQTVAHSCRRLRLAARHPLRCNSLETEQEARELGLTSRHSRRSIGSTWRSTAPIRWRRTVGW